MGWVAWLTNLEVPHARRSDRPLRRGVSILKAVVGPRTNTASKVGTEEPRDRASFHRLYVWDLKPVLQSRAAWTGV